MKRTLFGLIAVGAMALTLGPALAQDASSRGTPGVESRGSLYTPAGRQARGAAGGTAARGGAPARARGSDQTADQDGKPNPSRAGPARGEGGTPRGATDLTRLEIARLPRAAVQVGLGSGGLMADRPPTGNGLRQGGPSQTGLGANFGLKFSF